MDLPGVINALEIIKSLGLSKDLTHTISQAAVQKFTADGNNSPSIREISSQVVEDDNADQDDAEKIDSAREEEQVNMTACGNPNAAAWKKKIFLQAALSNVIPEGIPLPSTLTVSPPRFVGGNVIVEVDDEAVNREAMLYRDDIHMKLFYQLGDRPNNLAALKQKLSVAWGFENFDLSHIGNGWFHIFLNNTDRQSIVLCKGPLHLKPGFVRVSRWMRNFNPFKQCQTNAQILLRIHDLPMECRGADMLFSIARGAGWPIKIDPETRKKGPYVRMQVDTDCSRKLPEKLVVHKKVAGDEFWVRVHYEFYPYFCTHCEMLGHHLEDCSRANPGLKPSSIRNEYNAKDKEAAIANNNGDGQHSQSKTHASDSMEETRNQTADGRKVGTGGVHNDVGKRAMNDGEQSGIVEERNPREVDPTTLLSVRRVDQRSATNLIASESSKETRAAADNAVNACTQDPPATDNGRKDGAFRVEPVVGHVHSHVEDSHANVESHNAISAMRGTGNDKDHDVLDKDKDPAEILPVCVDDVAHTAKVIVPNDLAAKMITQNNQNGPRSTTSEPQRRKTYQEQEEEKRQREADAITVAVTLKLINEAYEHAMACQSNSKEMDKEEDRARTEEQKEINEMDENKIYWRDDVFAHKSGMVYDPDEKRYYTWVSNDEDDLRCLYYWPNQHGDFKLAVWGELGRNNNEVLDETDWDRSSIHTECSFGFRSNLLQLFKLKFKEGNQSKISS